MHAHSTHTMNNLPGELIHFIFVCLGDGGCIIMDCCGYCCQVLLVHFSCGHCGSSGCECSADAWFIWCKQQTFICLILMSYLPSMLLSTIFVFCPQKWNCGSVCCISVVYLAEEFLCPVAIFFLQKKHLSSKPKVQVEMGTQNNKTDVDFDWLPRETLQDLSASL